MTSPPPTGYIPECLARKLERDQYEREQRAVHDDGPDGRGPDDAAAEPSAAPSGSLLGSWWSAASSSAPSSSAPSSSPPAAPAPDKAVAHPPPPKGKANANGKTSDTTATATAASTTTASGTTRGVAGKAPSMVARGASPPEQGVCVDGASTATSPADASGDAISGLPLGQGPTTTAPARAIPQVSASGARLKPSTATAVERGNDRLMAVEWHAGQGTLPFPSPKRRVETGAMHAPVKLKHFDRALRAEGGGAPPSEVEPAASRSRPLPPTASRTIRAELERVDLQRRLVEAGPRATAAAITLQAAMRGKWAKEEADWRRWRIKTTNSSATSIQASQRRLKARKRAKRLAKERADALAPAEAPAGAPAD